MDEPLPPPLSPQYSDNVNPFAESRYDDRPSLPQRMSSLNLGDDERRQSPRKGSLTLPKGKNYLRYTFTKLGEDWSEVVRKENPLDKQADLAQKVRSGKSKDGNVMSQLGRMGGLRKLQLEELVKQLNAKEGGAGFWELAWLETSKFAVNKIRNMKEILAMDVVVARNSAKTKVIQKPIITRQKSKKNLKYIDGEVITVPTRSESFDDYDYSEKKAKKEKKDKKKNKDEEEDDDHGVFRRYTVSGDPFNNAPLFASDGTPMDDRGPIPYDNAGLPPQIPRDRPIGAHIDEHHRDRSKSRPKDDYDGIVMLGDDDPVTPFGDEVLEVGENLGEETRGSRHRRRRRSSVLDPLPKSHSRSRPRKSGSRSRSRSRPRQASRHHRGGPAYAHHTSRSSIDSGESHIFEDYDDERSSHTSQDTHHAYTGRGSLYHTTSGRSRDQPYRQHHRGPSFSQTRPRYPGDELVMIPESSLPAHSRPQLRVRRTSYVQPSQGQQLMRYEYEDEPYGGIPLSPRGLRSAPILVYPDEIIEREREQNANNYMEDRMRDEAIRRREDDIARREERIARAEADREREAQYRRPSTTRYVYDDDYSGSRYATEPVYVHRQYS